MNKDSCTQPAVAAPPSYRVLSVQQPWAELIVSGVKDVENRTWATSYRGSLYIHAGKTWDPEIVLTLQLAGHLQGIEPDAQQLGGIVGLVDLVDCVKFYQSGWFSGPYGFVLRNPRRVHFTPLRGELGIWHARYDLPAIIRANGYQR